MKKCSPSCIPLCDFCRHYNFNADRNGIYTDRGYCRFHHKKERPEHYCKDFWCYSGDYKKNKKRHDYSLIMGVLIEFTKHNKGLDTPIISLVKYLKDKQCHQKTNT